jgi:hypothetical protein
MQVSATVECWTMPSPTGNDVQARCSRTAGRVVQTRHTSASSPVVAATESVVGPGSRRSQKP